MLRSVCTAKSIPILAYEPHAMHALDGKSFLVGHNRCMQPAVYKDRGAPVNNIIYIVGLVVIVIAILSWLGFR